MIVSYEQRFLFIHIPKTGGTSVRRALEPYCHQSSDRWTHRWLNRVGINVNLIPCGLQSLRFARHSSADLVRRKMSTNVFDSLFKFSIVRNPYELLVSNYCFLRSNPGHKRHSAVSRMSFDSFVDFAVQKRIGFQLEMLSGSDGRILVDYIGRFERLNEDFLEVQKLLCLIAPLPHLNISEHRDFRSFYNAETKARVSRIYARDFDAFGYSFDAAAARKLQSRRMRIAA